GAGQRLLRQVALSLELRDLCLELGIVHLEKRRPLLDLLSLPDQDFDDAPVDFGAQVDRLHGFDLTRRADLVSNGVRAGDDDFHRHAHGCAPTPTRGIRTAGLALAASARCDRECRDYPEPFTCLDHVRSPLFLFGKEPLAEDCFQAGKSQARRVPRLDQAGLRDRKSTRLNSSHVSISYAVFCLKKKKKTKTTHVSPQTKQPNELL